MNREFPEGLSSQVLDAVLPICDALTAAGWTLGLIQWEGALADRRLSFSAESRAGASVYVACHESHLTGKLQGLLDSESK
jgi:hypothetical protein